MLDRLGREQLRSTIVDWNIPSQATIRVDLPSHVRDAKVELTRPDSSLATALESGFLDRQRFGVTIADAFDRGVYTVAAWPRDESQPSGNRDSIWEQTIAVNGEPDESVLESATSAQIATLAQRIPLRSAKSADDLSVGHSHGLSDETWWWCALVVLILVGMETVVLMIAQQRRPTTRDAGLAT